MDRKNETGSGRLDTKPKCTDCGTLLDGFAGTKDEYPSDGDFTVCGCCGAIGKYADGLTSIKALTLEELKELREKEPAGWHQLMNAKQFVMRNLSRKPKSPDYTRDDGLSFDFK